MSIVLLKRWKRASFYQGCADTSIRKRIRDPKLDAKMVSNPVSKSVIFLFGIQSGIRGYFYCGIQSGIRIRKKFFWYPIRYPNPEKNFLVSNPVSESEKKIFWYPTRYPTGYGYRYPMVSKIFGSMNF